jgi:hydroxypyruvate isomerase
VRTYGLKFDVNCSILFTELPLLKRPAAARAAGFDAVEFWWPFDNPRAVLVSSQRALALISQVRAEAGVTNLAFLADLYHLGKMAEDLPGTLARDAAAIAHVQIADVPDRGAPGTGELDCEALFGQLAAQGYAGWIGCEYKPSDPADSSASFGWRSACGMT